MTQDVIKNLSIHFITCGLFCLISSTISPAQTTTSGSTQPVGYITLNIPAGTGTSYTLATISLPMHRLSQGQGKLVGTITGITANTVTNNNAGWSANAFSSAATPFALKITSGTAEGRILLISSSVGNTDTTVTVDNQSTDLTTLGIVVGTDTYEILPVDTLLSLFGTPNATGIQGGTTETTADHVQIFSATSGWLAYYYNTSSGKWLRIGPPIDSNNVILRPDQGIIYSRIANSELRFNLIGRVPSTHAQVVINNGGITFIGSNWPANSTLATSGIQNLPGWIKSTTYTSADQVQMYTPSNGWRGFYHNGTRWMRIGPPIQSDNEPIYAGSAIIVIKLGNATGVQILDQYAPYTLNQ